MKIEIEVDDTVKRTVRGAGTSGRANVSKGWIGRDVLVCLLPEGENVGGDDHGGE